MQILYATDGSDEAIAAGAFLRNLSLDKDAHIHIVTVTNAHDRDALLQAARARLGEVPARVTTEALPGNSTAAAINQILRAGDAMAADFIVVGASGLSAFAQFFVGSVAAGVTRQARRSVLVVRTSVGIAREFAVVGVDGSQVSHYAALWVSNTFPLPLAYALHLIAVVPSQTWATFTIPSDANPQDPALAQETRKIQTVAEERIRAEACMESLARELQSANRAGGVAARQVTAEVRQGIPSEELIQVAQATKAKLVILGPQGRMSIDEFLIGGVSEHVLRHAPCAVLIVKTPNLHDRAGLASGRTDKR